MRRQAWEIEMRKVIQITTASDSGCNDLFALCDDGTIWVYTGSGKGGWLALAAIPQYAIDTEPEKPTDVIDLEAGQ